MVLPAGFQPAAYRLGGDRSMQLSYGSTSIFKLADKVFRCLQVPRNHSSYFSSEVIL